MRSGALKRSACVSKKHSVFAPKQRPHASRRRSKPQSVSVSKKSASRPRSKRSDVSKRSAGLPKQRRRNGLKRNVVARKQSASV